MPRPTESKLDKLSKPVSGLSRFIQSSLISRRKVFYDSPGLLDQSQHWGGLVIWTIAAGTSATLLWAFLGRVDQTVTATGTLQPLSGKMIVSTPVGGIVREVFVTDGDWWIKVKNLLLSKVKVRKHVSITQKQLALFRYENQLFNLLLDQSGRFDLDALPEPLH